VTIGLAGQPAVLQGILSLNRPVDLSGRSQLLLRVDGGEAREIDCRGETPARTQPDEVVERLNRVFPGLAQLDETRRLTLSARNQVELLALRYFTLHEFNPVSTHSPETPVRQRLVWSVFNESVREEPFEWRLLSLRGIDRPRLTRGGGWVQANTVVPAGFTLHIRLDDDGQVSAWMDAPGRARYELSTEAEPDHPPQIEFFPDPQVLRLPPGESHWQYRDCYGDRYDEASFGRRRGRQPRRVPGYYAGGRVCHTPGVFNSSNFYQEEEGYNTVFGSVEEIDRPQASTSFAFRVHQPGRFELQLPADLPDRFGGRFNLARFGQGSETGIIYPAAIFDLPEDEQALDEQVNRKTGMLVAELALDPDDRFPQHPVPFNELRPFAGGGPDTYAGVYLFQPGVDGFVLLRTREVGEWGNDIRVAAPESETPGGFDVTIIYTGQIPFENARQKVEDQVILARAAGIEVQVTRR
jgi:hypothetical protein